MRTIILTIVGFFMIAQVAAQKAAVTWGENFKMKRGSTDLSVIHADNDGVYIEEGHIAIRTYFVIGASLRESATLVKLNKNLEEQYRNNFNKELKKKNFEQFFFIQDKLYLMAIGFDKKIITLYATEIDKTDGQVKGEWVALTSWEKESKKEQLNFKVDYNGDSTNMIIVSTIAGKENHEYGLLQFDTKLKKVGKTVTIRNSFERNTFQLEDIVYANNGNIVMVARAMEYREGKKKKAKFLDFKKYVVIIYDENGKLLKELNTGIEDKFLISTKVSQIDGKELVLAAFYSNGKKAKETDGMLVQRIDSKTGAVLSTSMKELNMSLITTVEPDEDETSKERKEREKFEKMQEEAEGFSKNMRFRNFLPTADGGLVILAEAYTEFHYSVMVTNSRGYMDWVYYTAYLSGNIMMSKVDATGNLNWLHVLPKNHREDIRSTNRNITGYSMGMGYFTNTYNFPFYSGFASMPVENSNTIAILFNDGSKNSNVLRLGQKVRRTMRFGKSDFNYVQLDATTGNYTRTQLFNNDEVPTAMPRLGSNISNIFYMVGKQDRVMAKTRIALAKIIFK